MLYIILKMRLT